MDKNLASVKQMMETTYGKEAAVKWTVYWRTFLYVRFRKLWIQQWRRVHDFLFPFQEEIIFEIEATPTMAAYFI